MTKCITCNTELSENHPSITLAKLLSWVETNYNWDSALADLEVGSKPIDGVEVVAIKKTYDRGDVDVDGYYGESALPQGSEFEGFVVFKIGELFYRKTGKGDSYGEVTWDGNIKIVEAKPKTVWTFE